MNSLANARQGICFVLRDESNPQYRLWHRGCATLYELYSDYVAMLQNPEKHESDRQLIHFMECLSYAPSRTPVQRKVDAFHRDMGFHPGNIYMKRALFSVAKSIFDGSNTKLEDWIEEGAMDIFRLMHHSDDWSAVAALDAVDPYDSLEPCTNEDCTDENCTGGGICNNELMERAAHAMQKIEEEEYKQEYRIIRDHRYHLLKSFGELRLCLEKEQRTKEDEDLIIFWKAFSLSPTRTDEQKQIAQFQFWFGFDPSDSVKKADFLMMSFLIISSMISNKKTNFAHDDISRWLTQYGPNLFHYYDYASWSIVMHPSWKY